MSLTLRMKVCLNRCFWPVYERGGGSTGSNKYCNCPKLVLSFTTLCIRHSFPNASILSCIWLSLPFSTSLSHFFLFNEAPATKKSEPRHSLAAQPMYLYASITRGGVPAPSDDFFSSYAAWRYMAVPIQMQAQMQRWQGAYMFMSSTFLTHVGASLVLVSSLTEWYVLNAWCTCVAYRYWALLAN